MSKVVVHMLTGKQHDLRFLLPSVAHNIRNVLATMAARNHGKSIHSVDTANETTSIA
jgi:hypothetical protein